MNPMLTQPSLPTPLLLPDKSGRTAKASIRKTDTEGYYAALGGCIEEVRRVSGLTLKEFAAVVGKDERQIARQVEGKDRPQLEAVFAVERFRGPLVIALARLAAGCEIDTVIHVRRSV
jgi:hypothetical protein